MHRLHEFLESYDCSLKVKDGTAAKVYILDVWESIRLNDIQAVAEDVGGSPQQTKITETTRESFELRAIIQVEK
jgi:hypothetical protein